MEDIETAKEALAADLRMLRIAAGNPSLRDLERLVGHRFSKNTIDRIFKGTGIPKLDQLLAIVAACGGSEREWRMRWQHMVAGGSGEEHNPPRIVAMTSPLYAEDVQERVVGLGAIGTELRDAATYHWSMVAALEAFIRDNAPITSSSYHAEGDKHPNFDEVQVAIHGLAYRARVWEPRPIDLRNTDLRQISAPRAWLVRAKLSGAWLHEAEFLEAHLEGCDLTGARLNKSNLRRANLSNANLTDTDLRHARLTRAVLRHSLCVRTDLRHARLDRANFTNARVEGISLHQADPDWGGWPGTRIIRWLACMLHVITHIGRRARCRTG
jgi:uncharacterized protein YjbI with pentapeptide repeats